MNVASVTTTNEAITAGYAEFYIHVETDVEACDRISNEKADAAMLAGLCGDYELADERAELADIYADQARAREGLERLSQTLRTL